MANLAEAVDATETDWIISADLSDAIDYLTVESEIVKITANFPAQRDPQTRLMQVSRIRVERGAGGTTAASHADTTALTPLIPPSSGGAGAGGVTVDNTVDAPFSASTFIAEGATESAPDEATLSNPNVIQGAADEGGDGAAVVAGSATTNNGGNLDLSGGSGLAGKGGGNVMIGGGTGDGGNDSGAAITVEGGAGGGNGRIELAGDEVTFNIGNPVQVPASPTEQDIVDALVALGLITQAAP